MILTRGPKDQGAYEKTYEKATNIVISEQVNEPAIRMISSIIFVYLSFLLSLNAKSVSTRASPIARHRRKRCGYERSMSWGWVTLPMHFISAGNPSTLNMNGLEIQEKNRSSYQLAEISEGCSLTLESASSSLRAALKIKYYPRHPENFLFFSGPVYMSEIRLPEEMGRLHKALRLNWVALWSRWASINDFVFRIRKFKYLPSGKVPIWSF